MTVIYCTKCRPSKKFENGNDLMEHMDRRHPPLEEVVQREVIRSYQTVGCTVYDLSQGYRPHKCKKCGNPLPRNATSRQTPGLGDLYVLPPMTGPVIAGLVDNGYHGSWLLENKVPWWHETKRKHLGVQSPEQVTFQEENRRRGIVVVVGGVDEAVAELRRREIVK